MSPAPNSPQVPDNDLTRTLRARADDVARHGNVLDLEQVVSRAGAIRRARRVRTSMAMAAVVLAVAVPVGISALGDHDPTRKGGTPTVAAKPDHSPISLGDLRAGAAPASGYLADGTLHVGDEQVRLTETGSPAFLARIAGGFLVGLNDDDTGEMVATFVPDDASGGQSWPLQSGFAVSPEGNVGAFVQPDGTVVAVQDGGSRYYEVGKVPAGGESAWETVAVTGENCSGRSDTGAGCRIYVEDRGVKPAVGVVEPHRDLRLVHTGLIGLDGVTADGVVAGTVSATDDGSCSAVLGADDTRAWDTCDYSLGSFSPDGTLLLGGPAYRDGLGAGSMAILDARTGEPVLQLDAAEGVAITSVIWEDDQHVVATVTQNGGWAVERIAVNGSREYALTPVDGDDVSAPFLVAQR
jgi:hypothetical protein